MKITSIKQQVKRANRYSVFIDDIYSFSLSETALLELRLASGQEIDESQLQQFKDASGNDKAYGNALRYVAMRPRSEWELRTYLRRKDVDDPVADDIVQRLQRVSLLDDLAFARSWVASRHLLKSTSKRRLQQELRQKHVALGVIDRVLNEDDVDERQSLRELVAKKQARYPDRNKLMQYLARQGFSYNDITFVLDQSRDDD